MLMLVVPTGDRSGKRFQVASVEPGPHKRKRQQIALPLMRLAGKKTHALPLKMCGPRAGTFRGRSPASLGERRLLISGLSDLFEHGGVTFYFLGHKLKEQGADHNLTMITVSAGENCSLIYHAYFGETAA